MNPTERKRVVRRRHVIALAPVLLAGLTACADQPAAPSLTVDLPVKAPHSPVRSLRLVPIPRTTHKSKPAPTHKATPKHTPARISWALTIKRGDPTPAQLRKLAWCESGRDHSAYGADGEHFGAYQFELETWASVGGTGNPAKASLAEQSYRVVLLYRKRGWQPWAASASCTGLRDAA